MIKLMGILLESLTDSYKTKGSFKTETVTETDEETGEEYPNEIFSPVQMIHFTTDKGIPYVWYARQSRFDDTSWEIAFGVNTGQSSNGATNLDIEVTGQGDAFRVFSTVIDITNRFIEYDENYEIRRLIMTSKGENRTNLYLKRILPRIDNFKVSDVTKSGDETTIVMERTH